MVNYRLEEGGLGYIWAAAQERKKGPKFVIIGGLRYDVEERKTQHKDYTGGYYTQTDHVIVETIKPGQFGVPYSPSTYKALLSAFHNAIPWKGGDDNVRPTMRGRQRYHTMRLNDDRSIDVMYCGTRFATWFPDGRISIDSRPQMGADYFSHMLPRGVSFYKYYSDVVRVPVTEDRSWWKNGAINLVAKGEFDLLPNKRGGFDLDPENPGDPFSVCSLDSERTRALSREYHFAEMRAWLNAVNTLQGFEWAVERHKEENRNKALDLMARENYAEAAQYLPLVQPGQCFGYLPYSSSRGEPQRLTPHSIEKVRHWLYRVNCVAQWEKRTGITVAQYDAAQAAARRYEV